jgi:hypothetical protein
LTAKVIYFSHIINEYSIVIAAFVCSNVLFAQDIITLNSGDDIKAKVEEIDIDNVKYKKYDNLSGPIYILKKSDIFMIKYENGDKDIFKDAKDIKAKVTTDNTTDSKQRGKLSWSGHGLFGGIDKGDGSHINSSEVRAIMTNVPDALAVYNKARSLRTTGAICYISGAIAVLTGGILSITSDNDYHDDDYVSQGNYDYTWAYYTVGGLVVGGLGLIFNATGVSKEKSAFNLYNSAKNNRHASLNFGLTDLGGIGFTVSF